jgi:hypothetical protein
LMSGGPKRSGLDDGNSGKKKRKRADAGDEQLKAARAELKIQPGESLSAFGRRVDAAIPVKFPRGGNGAERASKKKKAAKEPKVEEDPNVEPEEGEEINSDDDDEEKEMLREAEAGFEAAKRRRGRKRDDSPDPWAELEKRREVIKFGDVAHAPPTLKKPKPLLYMAGEKGNKAAVDVDGVPRAAGSLAKREELAGERRSLIEAYRKMMGEKRAGETL